MTLKQLDSILSALEKKILFNESSRDNFNCCNLNSIKCTLQLYATLEKINTYWSKSALRTSILRETVLTQAKEFLVNTYKPTEIRLMVLQKDVFGQNALGYFE